MRESTRKTRERTEEHDWQGKRVDLDGHGEVALPETSGEGGAGSSEAELSQVSPAVSNSETNPRG